MRRTFLFVALLVATAVARAEDFNLATSINQLGLDLYRTVAAGSDRGNLVISPYSISSALLLAFAGAEGATRTEMSRVLRLPMDDAILQTEASKLCTSLNEIARRSKSEAERRATYGGSLDPIEWRSANRLYGQRGHAFRSSFLALMRDGYAASFEPMDFRSDPARSRTTINGWVEAQTHQKIRDLIAPNSIGPETRLVLVNALYLKAPWANPFAKRDTHPAAFSFYQNRTAEVPTMHRTSFLGYAKEPGRTVVSLSYAGNELQFLIILPDSGATADAVAAKLMPADFARWSRLGEHPVNVALSLPKFRVEADSIQLGATLRALGMKSAFDDPTGSANFDRIAPRKSNDYFALSDVFHQTFVDVDEEGTEAAAATALLLVGGAAAPTQPVEVRVDRPFLFAIQDRSWGVCLFLGRIANPQ